jgi:hypothetical protein
MTLCPHRTWPTRRLFNQDLCPQAPTTWVPIPFMYLAEVENGTTLRSCVDRKTH